MRVRERDERVRVRERKREGLRRSLYARVCVRAREKKKRELRGSVDKVCHGRGTLSTPNLPLNLS